MEDTDLKLIVESLLFVSEEPLTLRQIQRILADRDPKEVREAVEGLLQEYEGLNRAFSIVNVAEGYQFRTKPQYSQWIRRLVRSKPPRLSRAALETLAIVAYKQPIVRAEIEQIRGVDTAGVLKSLLEKDLIRIVGRKEVPGRPMVYGTSRRFLELFNLKDLSGLPTLQEINELEEGRS